MVCRGVKKPSLPKGSCRAYARLRDSKMQKYLYLQGFYVKTKSLHRASSVPLPLGKGGFSSRQTTIYINVHGQCRGGYYPPAENSYKTLPPSDEGGGFCRRQKTEGETKIAVIPMLFSPSVTFGDSSLVRGSRLLWMHILAGKHCSPLPDKLQFTY